MSKLKPYLDQSHINFYKLVVMVAVSGFVLYKGLPMMLDSTVDDNTKKWAAGLIGTIIGYWIK